jgi:hypothetical protein
MITCSIKVNFDESLESWMGSGASIMSDVGMVWREIETFELQALVPWYIFTAVYFCLFQAI